MIGPRPNCLDCKNYDAEAPIGVERCSAFPNGIPDQIWVEGFDHKKKFPGDKGIRFTPKGAK